MSVLMLDWCKKEIKHLLPVTIFFLIAFLLMRKTEEIIGVEGLTLYSTVSCFIEALIMAKVVLITDWFAITERFSHKPLIYNTFWKSFLYLVTSILLRIIEGWISHEKVHSHFWIGQLWLAYLLIIFVGYRELISAVGVDKVKQLFFGVKDD